MPREISIVSSALSPDLRESASLASRLEFDSLQVPLSSPGLALSDLSRTGQRELVKVITSANLRLSSLFTTAGRAGLMPGADIDRALDHLDKALRTAADLASLGQNLLLCVDLGPLPPAPPAAIPVRRPVDPAALGTLILPESLAPAPPPPTPTVPRDEVAEAVLDGALIELGRRADRYGVPLALGSELGALASLHRAFESARCPLFLLNLDPVTVLRDEWDITHTLTAFVGRVGHVRVRDARKGAGGRTQPAALGQGDAQVLDLLNAINDSYYAGPLTVDPTELPDRANAASAGLALLRRSSI